ncbi:MAG: hypothetical protein H7321_02740 [Bacteroidia bacterium]|nr:hypothetical protein [Bacteroidia bacterium]
MKKYLQFLLAAMLLMSFRLEAATFVFTQNCLYAQEHIFTLKFDNARLFLEVEKKSNPDNMAVVLLENYIDFLENTVREETALYKKTKENEAPRLKTLKENEVKSGWYLFAQAEVKLQWAFIKLRMGDHFSAGVDLRDAYSLLKKNKELYPDFNINNKSLGLIEAILGAVPQKYNLLVKMVGLKGDIKKGIAKMELYTFAASTNKEDVFFKQEAAFMDAMLHHHLLKETEKAWTIIEPCTRNFKTNLLQAYMRATIAGYNGMNDEIITILSDKPTFKEYPFYYLDYMLGLAKLRKLDFTGDIYIKIFTVKYNGLSYIKSAYRYLALSSLLQGKESDYKSYSSICRKKGVANIEEDKQSEKESIAADIHNTDLLSARLLFDGKYYDKANVFISKVNEINLSSLKEKLELNYRKGRLAHEQKEYAKAKVFYESTIAKGTDQPYYFAAYSALQLGFIYEIEKNKTLAIKYFKMAKNDFTKNTEYVSSIDQKARAALKRLDE